MQRDKPGPGQESVWDYPRPPRLEKSSRVLRVLLGGETIAESCGAFRLLETSHPPSWYIPPADIRMELLTTTAKGSVCEWKGRATYWTVRVAGKSAENSAWSYESPTQAFAAIRSCVAFYANQFECYVDDERVNPQPGEFYGGWVTRDVVGPFKGIPGSWGW